LEQRSFSVSSHSWADWRWSPFRVWFLNDIGALWIPLYSLVGPLTPVLILCHNNPT
jgi:hypothetical protein